MFLNRSLNRRDKYTTRNTQPTHTCALIAGASERDRGKPRIPALSQCTHVLYGVYISSGRRDELRMDLHTPSKTKQTRKKKNWIKIMCVSHMHTGARCALSVPVSPSRAYFLKNIENVLRTKIKLPVRVF